MRESRTAYMRSDVRSSLFTEYFLIDRRLAFVARRNK
jgi:hypothetical protein